MAWLNFLDLRSLPAKEAEAVILPIPYEATTTYGAGTRQGPEAIFCNAFYIIPHRSTQVEACPRRRANPTLAGEHRMTKSIPF